MNVVFLGCTQNYSYQFSAANTKVGFLCCGLNAAGCRTSVINGVGGMKGQIKPSNSSSPFIHEIITYPYTDPLLGWIGNMRILKKDLQRLYIPDDINIVVLSNAYLYIYNAYVKLAHKLGYKVAVISHEWLPTVKRKYWIQNLNAKIYASTFGNKVEAILPISEYIIKKIEHFNKPYLKTPILGDFSNEPKIQFSTDESTGFVYCVYAFYFRVISKILRAYKQYIKLSSAPLPLTLVLSGPEQAIDRIRKEIQALMLSDRVIIHSKVKYDELIQMYERANALIIPLDPDQEQDSARFSQKIAEYLSSGSPIISNDVGEIKNYFLHGENIFIAEYTVEGFATAFKWIESNPIKARQIGYNGYTLGKKEFNLYSFSKKLISFFEKL